MKSCSLLVFLFAIFVVPAATAELPAGKWDGTFVDGELSVDALFEVEVLVREVGASDAVDAAETVKISMDVAGGVYPFSNIVLSEKQLCFQMNPGVPVECVLDFVNGIYRGECLPIEPVAESAAVITASPPAIELFMRPPPLSPEE